MFGVHDGPCDLGQGRWMKKLVLSMFFPFVIQGPMVLMRIIRPRVCTSCTSSRCADSRGMSCHKAFFCVVAYRFIRTLKEHKWHGESWSKSTRNNSKHVFLGLHGCARIFQEGLDQSFVSPGCESCGSVVMVCNCNLVAITVSPWITFSGGLEKPTEHEQEEQG